MTRQDLRWAGGQGVDYQKLFARNELGRYTYETLFHYFSADGGANGGPLAVAVVRRSSCPLLLVGHHLWSHSCGVTPVHHSTIGWSSLQCITPPASPALSEARVRGGSHGCLCLGSCPTSV